MHRSVSLVMICLALAQETAEHILDWGWGLIEMSG